MCEKKGEIDTEFQEEVKRTLLTERLCPVGKEIVKSNGPYGPSFLDHIRNCYPCHQEINVTEKSVRSSWGM